MIVLSVPALGFRVLHKKVPTALKANSIRRRRRSRRSSSKPQSDDLDTKLYRRRFGGLPLCVYACVCCCRVCAKKNPELASFFFSLSLIVCWFLVYTRSPIAHTLTRLLCTISSMSTGGCVVWCGVGGGGVSWVRAERVFKGELAWLGLAWVLRVCSVFLFCFLFKYMLLLMYVYMCVCVCALLYL